MENQIKNVPIREWAEDDRPREKLLQKGKTVLSNAELMAILIGSGNRNETALDLSKRILGSVNDNLIELSKLSVNDLMQFNGIGDAKAVTIVAALEIGKRRRSSEIIEKQHVRCSRDAFELMQGHMADSQYESFWVIMMNRANKVLRVTGVSEGGLTGTVVDQRKIFRMAIENHANSLILCHNHPSGNVLPSDADIKLTDKVRRAGELIDIQVLDHIILGDEKYFSFADEGKL